MEIEQILTNPEHPIESILEYCEKDVIATEKLFIEQLKDIERHFDNKGPLEIIQHGLFTEDQWLLWQKSSATVCLSIINYMMRSIITSLDQRENHQ